MKKKLNLTKAKAESPVIGFGNAYGERSFNSAQIAEFNFSLIDGEPIVEVEITVTSSHAEALKNAGMPVPKPFRLNALIDTGFVGSLMIASSAVKHLNLKPRGWSEIGYSGNAETRAYSAYVWDVDLAFKFINPDARGTNIVMETSASIVDFVNAKTKVDALIGQRILEQGVFTYNGKHGVCKLVFYADDQNK